MGREALKGKKNLNFLLASRRNWEEMREFKGNVCPPAGKANPENFAIFILKIIGNQGEEQSTLLGHRSFSGHKKGQFRVNLHHVALLRCQFSALNSKVSFELSSAHNLSSARSQPG